ncbi:MAG: U32 family peptidase [Bacilli bacterium]|nr:U32 family peptidase [Bacilli bacterium]MDD4053903.1 U32 family peptidase [Bacilli bacterium]
MKTLVMPNNLSDIDKYKDNDGFIIGVKDLSWFIPLELSIVEVKDISPKIKEKGKELFVSLNKIIYNQDIPLLKEYLLILDDLGLSGIMYDDIAVFNIAKNMSLKTPLVWFGTHAFTNYHTANYWYNKGVKYGVVGTEITLDKIKEISNNTEMSLMMYGYGYLPMFVSSRPLISSYFKHIGGTKEDKVYHMYEEARKMSYPTYEDSKGTVILSAEIINTINELPIINKTIDYLILSSLNIPSDKFLKVYNNYIEAINNLEDKEKLNTISKSVANNSPAKTDKGFLYKETIYRVKE